MHAILFVDTSKGLVTATIQIMANGTAELHSSHMPPEKLLALMAKAEMPLEQLVQAQKAEAAQRKAEAEKLKGGLL